MHPPQISRVSPIRARQWLEQKVMTNFYMALFFVGALISIVGGLWLLLVAFRESVAWGLGVLFVPFASLVFVFRHWGVAKWPFLFSLLGGLLMAPTMNNWDEVRKQKVFAEVMAHFKNQQTPAPADQKPETPLMKQERLEKMQAAFVQHAAELKAKYDTLQAQWAKLPPNDRAARAAFDQQATVYQTMRKQVETEKSEVDAMAAAMK
jgi:hypothetical protein